MKNGKERLLWQQESMGDFQENIFSSIARVEIRSQSKLGGGGGVTFFQPSVNTLFKRSILHEMTEAESQLK